MDFHQKQKKTIMMMVENKDMKLEKLQKAVNTFVVVNDAEKLKSAFEDAKKSLIQEFKDNKRNIEDLSKKGIITFEVRVNEKIEIVLEHHILDTKAKPKPKQYFTINFLDNKIEVLNVTNYSLESNVEDKIGNPKTFKLVYDSINEEFCFLDEDKKEKVDIFESVIEMIAKDILAKINGIDKSKIII